MRANVLKNNLTVIPDGAQRRAGIHLSTSECAERWVPALAALGRDDGVSFGML